MTPRGRSLNHKLSMATENYDMITDQREHVLLRPDMYVGSVRTAPEEVSIVREGKIVPATVPVNPGLVRIFIEPLSNAIDNVWRSKKLGYEMRTIKVTLAPDHFVIMNDGYAPPVERSKDNPQVTVPHMIFGMLMSGSNLNDDEDRLTSGRNGLGVKLTNIYSTSFSVTVGDPKNGRELTLTWQRNMSVMAPPRDVKYTNKGGKCIVQSYPDFARFGMTEFSPDLLGLLAKYVVDAAMITGINVYLNEEKVPVRTLSEYANLYLPPDSATTFSKANTDKEELEVVVAPAPDRRGRTVSFVNGIETKEGGVHEAYVRNTLLNALLEKVNPKKGQALTLREALPFFSFFIKYTVPRPEFTSQEKVKLAAPAPKAELPDKLVNAMAKWDVVQEMKSLLKDKDLSTLKKAEKKRGFKRIEGLDPANNAGGKHSAECTLILCEGLSAKTYAVRGIEVGAFGKQGRDWFGIYPLRGKLLNVRNASATTIAGNREITDIIAALNLRHGVDYSDPKNYETLNYGRVMILTDADTDGLHIAGLIINMFDVLYPTLLRRDGFLVNMRTPIVMVYPPAPSATTKKKAVPTPPTPYYTLEEFAAAPSSSTSRTKYFKGLGSWNPEEAKDSFGRKVISYEAPAGTEEAMGKVFSSKQADERKRWLEAYSPSTVLTLGDRPATFNLPIAEYLDKELIKFSIDDCRRSIPSVVDGLKESQRKILYAVFLKGLPHTGATMKVAQLAGFVAERTNYHHGEVGLFDTIIKMADNYVGSNNLPLLFRDGQFGSRLCGGKDAANGRYIHTKLEAHTRALFHPEDDPVLTHLFDDGDKVEPEFFVPVIPTLLLNGCTAGIGTGWSTSVPNYALADILLMVREWIATGTVRHDPVPTYAGFTGTVERTAAGKYATYGRVEVKEVRGVPRAVVTELPVGMWTEKFKDQVEEWLEEKKVKSYKNYSTATEVHFEITLLEDGIKGTVEDMKLRTNLSTTNMVFFTAEGKLKKYDTIQSIVEEWCPLRLTYYARRKEHQLADLRDDLDRESNKRRFVEDVVAGTIPLRTLSDAEADALLDRLKYGKRDGSYRYLLSLPFRSLTTTSAQELAVRIRDLEAAIATLSARDPRDLWSADLSAIEKYA